MSEPLETEWRKHMSSRARHWFQHMLKLRKVVVLSHPGNADLRMAIRTIAEAGIRDLIDKDRHLLELALATDRWIVSLDRNVQRHVDSQPVLARFATTLTWIADEPRRIPPRTR